MMEPDDQTLLIRISQGDQKSLEHLYARYRLRVYSYLFHQLDSSASWTEEIVQDVFFNVWQSARQYRGEAKVATWLFRIAHHLATMAKRNQARRAEGHLVEKYASATLEARTEDVQNELYPVVESPEDMVVDRLALADAFHQLSTKHRSVLELVYYHGFSRDEVAHILNVPAGTVKSRINYARRELHALLHQAEVGEEINHDA